MPSHSEIVLDQYERPIAGAQVLVLDRENRVAEIGQPNPATTDVLGRVSFTADDGVYLIEFRYGGQLLYVKDVTIGTPPEYVGPPGPAFPTFLSLATFKAAPATNQTQALNAAGIAYGVFTFQTTNAPYVADNVNVIKADDTALTIGAWVRQAAAGLTFQQAAPNAVRTSLADHLAAYVTPMDFGGDSTGKLADMLASGKRLVMIPEGEYVINASLTIPAETKIVACTGARFLAGGAGLTLFRTTANTFGTQWQGGRFIGNGFSGVTCFDLISFRHAAEIGHTWMEGIATGIYARNLCWDTVFRHNFMTQVVDGFIIGEGSNAVTIDHPGISGFASTGITVLVGTGPLPVVGNNITGGYIQGGPAGILDQGRGTNFDGTYFEECSDADISLSGALMPIIQRSYHSSTGGRVCVQGRSCEGAQINNVVLQGDRSVGLFDFDASNSYCRAELARTATDNLEIGIIDGIHLARRLGGAQEPGDIGWDGTEKVYVIQGTGPGNFIMRGIANGYDDVASGAGLAINTLRKEGVFYQVVTGGEAFTFSNMRDGQTVTLMVKMSGVSVTPPTVAGIALDMTGVADGKRKVVRATMIAADSNTVWVDEGPWK